MPSSSALLIAAGLVAIAAAVYQRPEPRFHVVSGAGAVVRVDRLTGAADVLQRAEPGVRLQSFKWERVE